MTTRMLAAMALSVCVGSMSVGCGESQPAGETGEIHSASVDRTDCTGAYLQLFDEPGFKGKTVCLSGSGDVDLGKLPRTICSRTVCVQLDWHKAIRSWRSVGVRGQFSSSQGTVLEQENYCAEGSACALSSQSIADAVVQHAVRVSLVMPPDLAMP